VCVMKRRKIKALFESFERGRKRILVFYQE
jgi:hypothetical protein